MLMVPHERKRRLILVKALLMPSAKFIRSATRPAKQIAEADMMYSSLMVHLDLYQPNDARLHVAGDLAEQFDSKLVGIACCQPQPSVYAEGAFAQGIVRQLEAEANEKLEELERRFKTAYQNRIKDIEWRSAFALPADYVAREARVVDLVITAADRIGGLGDP